MKGMSAIPIMNAKMDTGLDIAPANERGKLSIEDAALPLESNQLIGLMDSLFISVIEWLKGQMLDQNFACVYVVNVDNVESRIFRSYLSGLFGIMMLARQLIGSAGVYYDEDFCPDSHELDLEPRDNAPVVDLIKYFKENLIEILKEPREKFGDLFGALDSTIIDNESIETHIPAIIDRFQFLIVTIEIFERLLNNDDVDGLQKAIQLALCQLELIYKTVSLGTNMDHSFDVMIHRKFFPQTPMAVKKLPTNEGIEIWKEMLQQLSQIALIKSNMRPDFLFGISFLIYFSISLSMNHFSMDKVSPTVLTMSYLYRSFLCDKQILGQFPISEYLKDSISSFIHVPYFESINENILEITSVALSQCSKTFATSIKTLSLNRARQRRQLFHLIQKWESLQMDLERADVQLYELDQMRPDANSSIQNTNPFSSWAYFHKLYLIIITFTMGFELELYAPFEYDLFYCYIYYLYSILCSHVEDMMASSNNKPKDLTAHIQQLDLSNSSSKLEIIQKILNANRLLTLGSFRLCCLISRLNPQFNSKPTYFDVSIHYKNRFKHMGLLQSPALLQPAQYLATLHPIYEQDIKLFLEEVITVFVTCQLSWIDLEKTYPNDPNVSRCLKVCTHNVKALETLKCQAENVTLDFSIHSSYPSIKLP
ncbi:Mak10 subunit, NatC N-terminal acetyltransferase-domain-containing protein [Globomyces pollinis-pini]|nr:Mak10 subunit, NatC N-terminal acetyltransferase-domain-containing protein [Globomyces pollinis-pini]